MKAQLSAMAALLLAGCASFKPAPVTPGPIDEPPQVTRSIAPRAVSGGVYREGGLSLTSDSRAFRVGDVVTVILQETTQASKSAGTTLSKDNSRQREPAFLAGQDLPERRARPVERHSFEGDATSTQQNALSGAITVIVQEVLPNGLLRVAGEKALTAEPGRGIRAPARLPARGRHRFQQPGVLAAHRQCAHRLFGQGHAGRSQPARLADPFLPRPADAVLIQVRP
jgi:flagellar L-ring protein precursor FlgH